MPRFKSGQGQGKNTFCGSFYSIFRTTDNDKWPLNGAKQVWLVTTPLPTPAVAINLEPTYQNPQNYCVKIGRWLGLFAPISQFQDYAGLKLNLLS